MINQKETIMAEKECEDYIERKTAFLWLRKYYPQDKLFIGSIIAAIPKADVQEIKHAKWIEYKYKLKCSNCNTLIDIDDIPEKICLNYCSILNYCPHCGAKMDSERND